MRDLVPQSKFQLKDFQRKNLFSAPKSFVIKIQELPYWTTNNLITPLSAFWELKLKWVPKPNKWFSLQMSERSNSQRWYMDSGCSKHMTGDIKNFLSFKTLQGGGVSFVMEKRGTFWELTKLDLLKIQLTMCIMWMDWSTACWVCLKSVTKEMK